MSEIDKLTEFEGLSFSIGEFHITDQDSKDRLKQLRTEIKRALKLQELVKELFKYGLPISLLECGKSMAKIQSLMEQSEK